MATPMSAKPTPHMMLIARSNIGSILLAGTGNRTAILARDAYGIKDTYGDC